MSSRESLVKLRELAVDTKQRTLNKHHTNKKKRAARKAKAKEVDRPDVPDLFGSCTNGGQTSTDVVNSKNVQQWFREGLEKLYEGKVTLPPNEWGVKERTIALKLLNIYGAGLLEKTVAYLCEHWEIFVENSDGRLSGKPTVNLLVAMKWVFADAELGKKPRVGKRKKSKRHAGEWKDGKRHVGLGW